MSRCTQCTLNSLMQAETSLTKSPNYSISIIYHHKSYCFRIQDLIFTRTSRWHRIGSRFPTSNLTCEWFRDSKQSGESVTVSSSILLFPATCLSGLFILWLNQVKRRIQWTYRSIPFFLISISLSNCVNSLDS